MKLNNKVMVKLATLPFLMGFSATVGAGRKLDPTFIITQMLNNRDGANYFPTPSTKQCCDACFCTLPYPTSMCMCADVAESCPSACKSCVCTRFNPPECHCIDSARDNCYIPAC